MAASTTDAGRPSRPSARLAARALLALLVTALAAAPATAHGAAAARGIDTRILADDDGGVGYLPDQCAPEPASTTCPASSGAADLLSLDVREAADADGAHIIWLRVTYQVLDDDVAGRSLRIALVVRGTVFEGILTSPDGHTYVSADFDQIVGPTDVGDGHPKALDLALRASRFLASAGDTLEVTTLESRKDAIRGDVMPGTYYVQGQLAPHVPAPEEVDTGPGTYVLRGPAALLTASTPLIEAGTATFQVTGAAAGLSQLVAITSEGPASVDVAPASLLLDDASTQTVTASWSPHATGSTRLVLVSDLGGFVAVDITLPAHAANSTGVPDDHGTASNNSGSSGSSGNGGNDGDGHPDADGDASSNASKGSPAAALGLTTLVIAGAALRARRH